MKQQPLLLILLFMLGTSWQLESPKKLVSKHGMVAIWYYQKDRVYIEMAAPTRGWVAIGFNDSKAIKGNYLLMGRIVDGRPEVIEHYTISAGNYKPIVQLGASASAADITGSESEKGSAIRFSLPVQPQNQYQKKLCAGTKLTLLLAYSQADDFLHHSIMRTAVEVKL